MRCSLIVLMLLLTLPVQAEKHKEKHYQELWCEEAENTEVRLYDGSRVDCIKDGFAVEVDFSYKWADSIGQTLLYAELTGLKPAVLLIVNEKSIPHLVRFHNAADGLGIRLFTIPE